MNSGFVNKLSYPNIIWGSKFIPSSMPEIDADGRLPLGQYAYAHAAADCVLMARDPIGCNKLFYGYNQESVLVVANRVTQLWDYGVKMADIFSCPPGEIISVSKKGVARVAGGNWVNGKYKVPDFDVKNFQKCVKQNLSQTFKNLNAQFQGYKVVVCLSGGLDSSIIASYSAQYFNDVTVASFTYLCDHDMSSYIENANCKNWDSASHDFACAAQVAKQLGLSFLPVVRSKQTVASVVVPSVVLGQDWRDFNVHCATVNLFLAQGIREAFPNENVLVLTGDLMNEFVCDYQSEIIDGEVYYDVPKMPLARRRQFFVRGLDAGDREIGVFSSYGLMTCQPYGAVFADYMSVPQDILEQPNAKQILNAPLLPDNLMQYVGKSKVRAQVGGDDFGTLGVYRNLRVSTNELKHIWCNRFQMQSPADCEQLIQFGRYRQSAC